VVATVSAQCEPWAFLGITIKLCGWVNKSQASNVSKLHPLRLTDKIFFITCNLRQNRRTFGGVEFQTILGIIEESRNQLGYLFCGYVLMPDHWHALIAPRYPVTISLIMRQVKSTVQEELTGKGIAKAPIGNINSGTVSLGIRRSFQNDWSTCATTRFEKGWFRVQRIGDGPAVITSLWTKV
jgi:REP element-mobilizing transposase RayT